MCKKAANLKKVGNLSVEWRTINKQLTTNTERLIKHKDLRRLRSII